MPSRRRFAFLPLLAILAAFLLSSSSAWAQSVSFPFFGGGEGNTTQSILTAFNYQWKFFGAIAGTMGGSANALYYMAITATLVGAILIVINKKYQDPVTIGTWFMLVLVMVFAPYNSQLLFYPLSSVQAATAATPPGGTPDSSSHASVCTAGANNSTTICGFTPQVVAAHLGSTLALMVYDVFQKDGLQSLSQQVNAQNAFRNDPSLRAKDIQPKWDDYNNQCRKQVTPPVLPAALNGRPANSNTSGTPYTVPFKDALDSIRRSMGSSDHSAPIAIAIPKFSSPAEAGGSDAWGKYTNGVNALREKILHQTNALTDNGAYAAAVDDIVKAIASQSGASSNPMLNLSSYITAAPAGGGTLDNKDPTMQSRMDFFINKSGSQSQYGQQLGDTSKIDEINPNSARFLSVLSKDPAIRDMPIEQVVYDTNPTSCLTDCGSAVNPAPGQQGDSVGHITSCGTDAVKRATSFCSGTINSTVGAQDDCIAKADILFKDAIKGMAANNYASYQPLLDKLNDTSTPNFSPTLAATDICTSLTDPSQPCSNAQNILTYIKENPDAQNKGTFAAALSGLIVRNSLNGGTPGTDTVSTRVNDPTGNSFMARFFNGLKGLVSDGIASTGLAVAGGIGYFIGNVMGNAILAIVKVLAQVALMGIIIMTPFVFLMGLLIPSNAAGMLIVTTLSVFVLKFYPATIAIIDYMIGTINSAQWAANGTLMGIELQGLLMLVEGLLAAKVLSLTFWLMFKMGDTNNLRAITNLESAADNIADAGAAAMTAVAAVAGTAVVGGIAAAAGKSTTTGKVATWAQKQLYKNKNAAAVGDLFGQHAAEKEVSLEDSQTGPIVPDGPTSDEASADAFQKSAEDDLKKDQEAKSALDSMMPEIQPGGEDDLLHAGWMSTVPMDKPGEGGPLGDEGEGAASSDEMAEEAKGTEKSPSLPEGLEETADGNLKVGGQVYEDGNWRKNASGQYEVRKKGSGVGFTGSDTWVPLDEAVANDSKFQPGGMSTQLRGVPLGGGAAGSANVNGEFGGALAAGDVNLQSAQTMATAGGASGNGPAVGSASTTAGGGAGGVPPDGRAPVAAGVGGTPPDSPTSPAAAGGERDLRVGRMEVAQANMPAGAQQQAAIATNKDDAEWLSKGRGERFLRGAWSGAIGSIAASGQLSRVPGVGQLMRVVGEIANEGTEAPIRAQAFWRSGKARNNEGYSGLSYWRAMKDQSALRMYQQREGVLAGAAAYNTLKDSGHLMSGWDNASNAAIQVAARQMSDQMKRAIHEAEFGKMTAEKYITHNMVSSLSPDLGVEYANFQFKQGSFNAAEITPVLNMKQLSDMNIKPESVDIVMKDGKIAAMMYKDGPQKGQQVYQTTAEHTGLESVTFLQRRAALEASVDAPMNLQKINSLHERKLWDRRNDIAKANKYVEDYKAGKIKLEDYDPSVAHFAGMTEAEAFVADEMHHFKPQQIRNHREKAYIFIAQKVAESKNRAVDASYDGIQEIMEGWQHDVARRKVEVSAAGRRATKLSADINLKTAKLEVSDKGYKLAVQHGAQQLKDKRGIISDIGREIDRQNYKIQGNLKKVRATDLGIQNAYAEGVEKAGDQIYSAMAKLGMSAQKNMSVYYNGTRVSLDNAAVVMMRELADKNISVNESAKLLSSITMAEKNNHKFIWSKKSPSRDKPELNMQLLHKDALKRVDEQLSKTNLTPQERNAAKALQAILQEKHRKGEMEGDFFVMDKIAP